MEKARFLQENGPGVLQIPHPGFEPGLNDPESFVLPLHQRGVSRGAGRDKHLGGVEDSGPARRAHTQVMAEAVVSSRAL